MQASYLGNTCCCSLLFVAPSPLPTVLLQECGFVASSHSWHALKNAFPDAWVSYLFADQILQQPAASFSSSPPDQYPLSDCTFIVEWLWFTFTLPWLFGPIKLKSPPSSTHPSLSLLSATLRRWKDTHNRLTSFTYNSFSVAQSSHVNEVIISLSHACMFLSFGSIIMKWHCYTVEIKEILWK